MTSFPARIYRASLRIQGAYVLLLTLLLLIALPGAAMAGGYLSVIIANAVVATGLGVLFWSPALRPRFLDNPTGALRALGAAVLISLAGLCFVLHGFAAVILLGLDDPLGRALALLSVVPTLLLNSVSWFAVPVLFAMGLGEGTTPPPPNTPANAPAAPPAPA